MLIGLKRLCLALAVVAGCYALVLAGIVLWTFEVTLQRWPIFVYASPFTIAVGDDVNEVRFLERLARLGHEGNQVLAQEPGQWSKSGSGINVNLKYTPLSGQGIACGPVSISLDWNKIRSIRLLRAMEDVSQIIFEPELISIFPARGCGPELCRAVPLDKIPGLLLDAIILTEDTNFFSHGGIDFTSIHRALETNIKAGRYVQGGSTISQQLIRMTVLTPEKTLWRKVNEILLAITADSIYSKGTILEAYLNRIYLGHWGPYPMKGVAEGARHLFGKDLAELDPPECAFLAATIRAPNIINPYRHPERARSRRNMVLGLLFKAGRISRDAYEEALESPVRVRKPGAIPMKADAFLDLVRNEIPKLFSVGQPGRQDVVTSLDPLIQSCADAELKKMGEAGLQSHVIMSVPKTGRITGFISPGHQKWTGEGGNLESLLPVLIVRTLVPEMNESKNNLTSLLFPLSASAVPMTLREAFGAHRNALVEKLSSLLGPDKIIILLKEFGVRARKKNGDVVLDPIGPMQMAQTYSLMANLGNSPALGPGIKMPDSASMDLSVSQRGITAFDPAIIFVVNYLLKGWETLLEEDGSPETAWLQPSLFQTRDKEGVWQIAYRTDALLVIRVPGHVKDAAVKDMVSQLFSLARYGPENRAQIPAGLLFRKICIRTGLLATSTCPRVIKEPFVRGSQPTEWCTYRHESSPVRTDFRK